MNYRRLFIPNCLIFLTIVTHNRIPILTKSIALLKLGYHNIQKYYDFQLIAYTIQPDHIHCIIKPQDINDYPKIIKSFKYSVTKLFNVGLVNPTYKKLWQNRYWEHTIINQDDLNKHLDYIHYNSYKHSQIAPKDWQYSSFKEFVEQNLYEDNWCNFGDINSIEILNYE